MKKQALAKFLNLTDEEAEDLTVSKYNDNVFEYCGEEYEVLIDEEAEDRWAEELDNSLAECIYSQICPKICNFILMTKNGNGTQGLMVVDILSHVMTGRKTKRQ